MDASAVKNIIESCFQAEYVDVVGEGAKYHVTVVSDAFADLRPVKKQQSIYACLQEHIASGAIHAVTMALYTPSEWAEK